MEYYNVIGKFFVLIVALFIVGYIINRKRK